MADNVLASDVDDLLYPFVPEFLRFHNDNYGTQLALKDITNFYIWQFLGCGKEEGIRRILSFYHDNLEIQPPKGAIEGINRIKKEKKCTLFAISSRARSLEDITIRFVERYWAYQFSGIYLLDDALPSVERNVKAQFCYDRNVKILAEDGPQNALAAAEMGIRVILPDKPWNQEASHRLIKRVDDDWGTITKAVLRYL